MTPTTPAAADRSTRIAGFGKLVSVCLCMLLFSGCANHQPDQAAGESGGQLADLITLPATFTGQIPCEDCDRVDIVLNLRPDGIYQLRKTYQSTRDPARVESQMRRWRFSPENALLILGKQKGLLKTYQVLGNDSLRFVQWEGAENAAQIQYDLARAPEVDPFPDVVKMRGMFAVVEGEASFVECTTGVRFAVDRGGVYARTVQNYMNTPHDPGAPLLLSMLGSLQASADLSFAPDAVRIDQFRRFYPNRDCAGNPVAAGLTGTYWMLDELDGAVLARDGDANRPFLTFAPDRTLRGSGGCNEITGTYLVKGDVFLFNREAATRIACPGTMELENRLLQALDESETYRVEEDTLLLLDQNERVRARFFAGP